MLIPQHGNKNITFGFVCAVSLALKKAGLWQRKPNNKINMATRSVIAKLNPKTKEIKAVYCHNDGYLEHNGTILDSHYQNGTKVDKLLQQGDLSTLDANIGEKINFDDFELRHKNKQCLFYNRDRGENRKEAEILEDDIALVEFANESCDAQFIYLYAYNAWYVYDYRNDKQFRELDDVLCKVYKD